MRLSVDSRTRFEEFLQILSAEEAFVPTVKIYSGKIADFLTKTFKVDGITIGNSVFVRSKFVWRDEKSRLYASKFLLAHEIAHVLQFQKYGMARFFYIYLRDYWKALKKKEKWDFQARREAYLEIPFEAEARQFSQDYSAWRENLLVKKEF